MLLFVLRHTYCLLGTEHMHFCERCLFYTLFTSIFKRCQNWKSWFHALVAFPSRFSRSSHIANSPLRCVSVSFFQKSLRSSGDVVLFLNRCKYQVATRCRPYGVYIEHFFQALSSSGIVFKVSEERYKIVQFFFSFEIPVRRPCESSNVNCKYKILLYGTGQHFPWKDL